MHSHPLLKMRANERGCVEMKKKRTLTGIRTERANQGAGEYAKRGREEQRVRESTR
jgi:hypothetical protein